MALGRTLAIARKEIHHIFRDPQILFMVLGAPTFALFLLGYTFAADLQQIRIGVWDQDVSPASRDYLETITSDGELRVVAYCQSYGQIERLLKRGQVDLVVVIPNGFHTALVSRRSTAVQLVIDASYYHESQTYQQNLEKRTLAWSAKWVTAPGGMVPLSVETRPLYNLTLSWVDALIPGLMAAAFCFPAIAVALAFTRETEQGTYEGLLSTPLRPLEYLLGKLVPYFVLGSIGTLFAWLLAYGWFRVPFRSTLGAYVVATGAFLGALLSMGTLIGVTALTQRVAIIIVVLTFFIPSFFLSGLLIPLEPGSMMEKILTRILPAANYVMMNRAIFLKGASIAALIPQMRNLIRISGVTLLLSLWLVRRKVA